MVNIYNFLKNVFQDIKTETSKNNLFLLALLLVTTIPLPFAVSNICLVLFVLFALIKFKKEKVNIQFSLLLPIGLFVLMTLSYFWSIDKESTLKAIPKEISLLLIPFVFLINKDFSSIQLDKLKKYYSYSIVLVVLYFLARAVIRYTINHDTRAFFYHGENEIDFGLVPKLLNAIHVSVFVAIALFCFLSKEVKTKVDIIISGLLFVFILLLSSKNIIVVVILLLLIQVFYFSKTSNRLRLRNLIVFAVVIGLLFSFGRIKSRFLHEFQSNSEKSISTNVIEGVPDGVHYVSLKEAWTNQKFTPNDYFPGTAFRVYQFRVFTEILSENNRYLSGFGLNASTSKVEEKAISYNLFLGNGEKEGYQTKNFHNQYIQNFADLGIFGFLLIITILFINLKNAIKKKDFLHFAFAFLMISLFLTESFLWRQRGVVFFTIMYCIFNFGSLKSNSKTE